MMSFRIILLEYSISSVNSTSIKVHSVFALYHAFFTYLDQFDKIYKKKLLILCFICPYRTSVYKILEFIFTWICFDHGVIRFFFLFQCDEMAESLRYKDKVTIVTGGSKGIGRGCVEVFG